MKKLIIAEKPELAKAIASAIPGNVFQKDNCLYKGDYIITWAFGHLLTLKNPEDYDEALKRWDLESLPIFFNKWEKKPKDISSHKRLQQIAELTKEVDVIIHAGDPDDEGQFLIDEIIEYCGYQGKVYRMETGDITTSALERALNNLTDNEPLKKIGQSAYARAVSDFMVGINLTRFFTLKNQPALLSIGRVQTPTLGLVVNRDMLIENHQKILYYDVYGLLRYEKNKDNDTVNSNEESTIDIKAKYTPNKNDPNLEDGRILNKNYAMNKAEMILNETLDVVINYEEVEELPPLPFNLVELQSYCSKKFGYTPKEVMEITQSLRENHHAITYNRSDCQYLTTEQYQEAAPTMQCVIGNIKFAPKELDMTLYPRCYNDEFVTAHTAIIPTNEAISIERFTEEEKNVYLAICKYFMAQFMPPAIKGRTKLTADLQDGGKLSASSTEILSAGYLHLFKKDLEDGEIEKEEKNSLSDILPGLYEMNVIDTQIEKKETKPPARYTMASLNKDMTRISKYVNDPEIKELLIRKDKGKKGENGSIGTVATRASIIELLIARNFLELDKKKHLISTPLGRELYRILPDELRRPDMTARWWVIQEDIKVGVSVAEDLTKNVFNTINEVIHSEQPSIDLSIIPKSLIKDRNQQYKEVGKCPRCGHPIIEGQKGYGCSGWKEGCKYVLWKKSKIPALKNTTITTKDAEKLLSGKKVLKKNLIGKSGKKFEAYLYLEEDNPKSPYGASIKFEFKEQK